MPEMEPPVSELSEKWARQPRLPPKRGLIKIKIFKTIFQSTFTSARKSIRPTSDSDAEGETAAGGRRDVTSSSPTPKDKTSAYTTEA
ncbi:hypothetical protein SAY87_012921 [Trapa incisa]|uniref:Uncharacterized protein n=1 Tax=Trapa incisa TaxID=236973 RepID=A0AAN7K7T1_9MYRT|nr:hypothetical protein SAY87_012921 [Trapa incisa]